MTDPAMTDPANRVPTERMIPAAKVHHCVRRVFWLAVSFSVLFGFLSVTTHALYWSLPGAPAEAMVASLAFFAGACPSSVIAYATHRMCISVKMLG